MNKKEWLDYLYYYLGEQQYDFKLFGAKKDGEKVITTKWYKYSEVIFPLDPNEDYKIDWINNRQILPNEVVLDYDGGEDIEDIIKKITIDNLTFYAFSTGSRGYHIHIFFRRQLNNDEKRKIIRKYGAEEQKVGATSIALEFSKHWKSGRIKKLIYHGNYKK